MFSRMTDRDRLRWIVAEGALIAGLVAFALYYLTAFRFGTLLTDDARQGDFQMWYLLPPQIRELDYPSAITGNWKIPLPYLPSAIAMMLPLSWMPQATAFVVWMVLQCVSFAIILWAGLRLAGIERSHIRLPVAALAVFIVSAPLEWDFRAHNNNLIYTALVMLGLTARRTWIAAMLLAVTANLKIYSAILIPGLLWRREYRLAVSMALAGLLIAAALPMLTFGFSHSIKLYGSWINEILYTMSAAGQAAAPITMRKTVSALFGLGPSASAAQPVTIAIQLLWVALVAAYFTVAARPHAPGSDSDSARLCDITVMLLLPLPISTWFVPYQAIVMLPAFILIVAMLIDERQSRRVRTMAAIASVGCVL